MRSGRSEAGIPTLQTLGTSLTPLICAQRRVLYIRGGQQGGSNEGKHGLLYPACIAGSLPG